jgi:hypothetical protein
MAAPRGATAHSVPNQVRGQPGAVIVKVTGGDVDELKAAGLLGVNTALSRCVPTASVDVVPDAVPLETGTGLPRLVVPSRNCAVPAAVAGVIVAVSVTGVPRATGEAGDALSEVAVFVGAAVTGWAWPGGAALASPPMSSNAAPTATAVTNAPTAWWRKDLLVSVMAEIRIFSILRHGAGNGTIWDCVTFQPHTSAFPVCVMT